MVKTPDEDPSKWRDVEVHPFARVMTHEEAMEDYMENPGDWDGIPSGQCYRFIPHCWELLVVAVLTNSGWDIDLVEIQEYGGMWAMEEYDQWEPYGWEWEDISHWRPAEAGELEGWVPVRSGGSLLGNSPATTDI